MRPLRFQSHGTTGKFTSSRFPLIFTCPADFFGPGRDLGAEPLRGWRYPLRIKARRAVIWKVGEGRGSERGSVS